MRRDDLGLPSHHVRLSLSLISCSRSLICSTLILRRRRSCTRRSAWYRCVSSAVLFVALAPNDELPVRGTATHSNSAIVVLSHPLVFFRALTASSWMCAALAAMPSPQSSPTPPPWLFAPGEYSSGLPFACGARCKPFCNRCTQPAPHPCPPSVSYPVRRLICSCLLQLLVELVPA
jgi:hypothetical protein